MAIMFFLISIELSPSPLSPETMPAFSSENTLFASYMSYQWKGALNRVPRVTFFDCNSLDRTVFVKTQQP